MKIQFDLSQFVEIFSGGLMYIYHLVELLNESGVACSIYAERANAYFPEFEKYHTTLKEKVTIIPEVIYDPKNESTIPFIQDINLVSIMSPPYEIGIIKSKISIATTPYLRSIVEKSGSECLYSPQFLREKDFSDKLPKKSGMAQPTILPYKDPIFVNCPTIPKLSRPEFLRTLEGLEIFVYPSTREGFGLPILEAMYCGCVVFVCNTKENADFIRDGILGYIINSDLELKEKLPGIDKSIGTRARDFVKKYHCDTTARDKLVHIYKDLMDRL